MRITPIITNSLMWSTVEKLAPQFLQKSWYKLSTVAGSTVVIMWGDPFCMCSFHHEVIDKVSWIKLVCIIYVIWNCWRLVRKSAAVDQDSARSYYIIPWLAFSTVFTIDVHIWWVEFYCCIQDSSQPEYCRASGTIFLELYINNLFNGYSVLFEAVESSEW